MSIFDPASRSHRPSANWFIYDLMVVCTSALYYALYAPLTGRNEGGPAWYARRLRPAADLPPPSGLRLWIHAVSAGEAKVADLVRARLMALDPSISVVLSASTRTGHARIARAAADQTFVMPLDALSLQRRTVRAVQPHVAALSETDFWPAHFAALLEAGVPVVALNASMSPRSARRHVWWPAVARATIRQAQRVYVQDEAGLARFHSLGVPNDHLEICGNLKLAGAGPRQHASRSSALPTVTFGNVHASEFKTLAPAIAQLRAERPAVRIIVVPRYPGRFTAWLARRALGAELAVVDTVEHLGTPGSLMLVNAMGTLPKAYASSDVGVVGGTFSRVGGHDLAEPMHNGAATIYGPDVERQQVLHAAFVDAGISMQVRSAGELAGRIATLLDDAGERSRVLTGFADLAAREDERLDEICRDLLALARRRLAAEGPPRSVGAE